uniref:Uncharacterized protein n=1 Tax=Rhizophora mucronata TaxID=61149 RepID=A0A2P2QHC5_RHIMU
MKRFVYAVRDQEPQSVIYILSTQNLSEQSAVDAKYLIGEICPDSVVTVVGRSARVQFNQKRRNWMIMVMPRYPLSHSKCLEDALLRTSQGKSRKVWLET